MRVIAGIYGSRPLTAPRGLATRPTTDRLRETLFNVLAPRIAGSAFADLYAGSGANGIEAISRGAGYVHFIENAPGALAAIRANLKALGIAGGFSIEARSVTTFLRRQCDLLQSDLLDCDILNGGAVLQRRFDIVFLDPPYQDAGAYSKTLNLLGGDCAQALARGAGVIAEHRYKEPLNETYGSLRRYRVLRQGDAALSFYEAQS